MEEISYYGSDGGVIIRHPLNAVDTAFSDEILTEQQVREVFPEPTDSLRLGIAGMDRVAASGFIAKKAEQLYRGVSACDVTSRCSVAFFNQDLHRSLPVQSTTINECL